MAQSAGAGAGIDPVADRWSFRLLAVAAGLVMAFGLAELLARGVEISRGLSRARSGFEGNVFEFFPPRHHRLLPDGMLRHVSAEFDYVWRNNALGMRDRDRRLEKRAGDFRILVLGDSMVQGHGVALEDTFTMRLEQRLNERDSGTRIEVLNAGVFGYSPLLESIYLRELLEPVQPDLVLVGFFLGNDVGEDQYYTGKAHPSAPGAAPLFSDHQWPWSKIEAILDGDASSGGGAGGGDAASSDGLAETLKGLGRRSRLLAMLKAGLDARRYPARRMREFALVEERRGDIQYDLGLVNFDILTPAERQAYWSVSLHSLDEMHALCESKSIPMAVLVIPPAERFLGATRFEEPYQILEEEGRRAGMPVLQLVSEFERRDPATLYYKYDRHLTPEGHRVAAEFLERELLRLELLPRGRSR